MTIITPPKPQQPTEKDVERFVNGAIDGKSTGRGIKRGKKEQIALIIDPKLLDDADHLAEKMGMSRSALICMGLYRMLQAEGER